MENQESFSYIKDMLIQINQTTLVLVQNQTLLFNQYQSLDNKIDIVNKSLTEKIDENSKKIDENSKKIDENSKKIDENSKKIDENSRKIDENSMNILTMQNTLTRIEKEIIGLRADIDTVYTLENDSRKKIQKWL